MTVISKSISIDAPINTVFEYASNYKKWQDWFEGVSSFKPTTDSHRGNGTRYAYKAKMMGLTVGIETEIHDFVQNKGWSGKATKGMPHQTFWKFESINEGTKFTYALEYDLNFPLIGKWIDKTFIKPQWDKIIERSLQNLRFNMENLR